DAAALARIVAVGKGKAAAPVGRRYLPPATTGEQDEGRLGGGRGGGGGEAGRGRGSTSGPERPVGGLTAASSTSAPCPSASRPSAWSGRPSRRPAPRRRQRPLGPAASPPRRPPRRAPAPRATCRGPRLARAAAASPRRTRRRPARQRPRGSRRRSRPAAPRARGAAAGWSLGRSAPGRSTAAPRRASHRRPRRRGRARRGRSWPGAAGAPARGAAPAPPRGARWPPAGGARSPRRRWPGWPPRPPWIGDRRGRGTRWRRAASPPRRSWSPAGKRSGRSRRPPTLWTYGPAATGSACPEAILWGMHVLRLGLDQDVVVDDENVRLGVLPVQLDHMDREGPQLELPPLARPSAPRLELWQATEASEGLRPRLVGEAAAGHGRQLVPQEAPERGVAAVAAHRPAVPGHREGDLGGPKTEWRQTAAVTSEPQSTSPHGPSPHGLGTLEALAARDTLGERPRVPQPCDGPEPPLTHHAAWSPHRLGGPRGASRCRRPRRPGKALSRVPTPRGHPDSPLTHHAARSPHRLGIPEDRRARPLRLGGAAAGPRRRRRGPAEAVRHGPPVQAQRRGLGPALRDAERQRARGRRDRAPAARPADVAGLHAGVHHALAVGHGGEHREGAVLLAAAQDGAAVPAQEVPVRGPHLVEAGAVEALHLAVEGELPVEVQLQVGLLDEGDPGEDLLVVDGNAHQRLRRSPRRGIDTDPDVHDPRARARGSPDPHPPYVSSSWERLWSTESPPRSR
ncbi:unnamed protein product, partial [Prorocentrum cordatum]